MHRRVRAHNYAQCKHAHKRTRTYAHTHTHTHTHANTHTRTQMRTHTVAHPHTPAQRGGAAPASGRPRHTFGCVEHAEQMVPNQSMPAAPAVTGPRCCGPPLQLLHVFREGVFRWTWYYIRILDNGSSRASLD